MKINAIIESKDGGTLVLDFPRSIYDVYEKLQSVGIRQSPHQITLSDEDGADVRVKLYQQHRRNIQTGMDIRRLGVMTDVYPLLC